MGVTDVVKMKAVFCITVLFAVLAFAIGQDNSHWCCKKDANKPRSKTISNQIPKMITKLKQVREKDGMKPCDDDDYWWSCPNMVTKYVIETSYRMVTEYKGILEPGRCATEDLICCEGFVKFMDQCFTPEQK